MSEDQEESYLLRKYTYYRGCTQHPDLGRGKQADPI